MNASRKSPKSLEQMQSNRAGRGGEERSTGTNLIGIGIGTDNDNSNDNNNDDNNDNSSKSSSKNSNDDDCNDEEEDGLNEGNARWLKFDKNKRGALMNFNPNFPVEAIDGYMRAMYRDFIAQFGGIRNDYYDPAYEIFDIRWGLDNCFSPLYRLDLLTEAIESRGEHLSDLTLDVDADQLHRAARVIEMEDIQKFAHFCVRCPKVTDLSISEGRRSFEEANLFLQEAAAAGNQCRLASLHLKCGAMDTWCDSLVAFLQSSTLLKELRLELEPSTNRAHIQAVVLQGLARNTSLEHLELDASDDWVVQPLETMLMVRRQMQGCHLPRLTLMMLTLTPQMALVLMRGVCLGSVGYLQLQHIEMPQSSFIQLVETLQESAVHPHFALKSLHMQYLHVYGDDRNRAFYDAISCLLNGVPGLEDVTIIKCVPFAYCAGPSELRKLTFIDRYMSGTSIIDFAHFLDHLPSSSIRILYVGLDDELMACIQHNPCSLGKLEQFEFCCEDSDAQFCFVLLKIFASSMRISYVTTRTLDDGHIDLVNQNEFDQLYRRNRCIQSFQSSFVKEPSLECARDISRHSVWPAALAVLYRMEVQIRNSLNCMEEQVNDDFAFSNMDIPVLNIAGIWIAVNEMQCTNDGFHAAIGSGLTTLRPYGVSDISCFAWRQLMVGVILYRLSSAWVTVLMMNFDSILPHDPRGCDVTTVDR